MTEGRRNFAVGLFMIAGLGALGYLLVLFGEAPSWLGGAEHTLRIHLNEVSGVIEEGTPVFLNGIKVGRVTELAFVTAGAPDQGVEVITRISEEFAIPSGAVAQCIGPTLGLGRGRIEIIARGAGAPIEDGGTILGASVNPLDKILPDTLITSVEGTVTKVGRFAETLTPVAEDLHELLKKSPLPALDDAEGQEKFVANLYSLIQRFDRVLASLDAVIGDPKLKNSLLEAVENVRVTSADARLALQDFRDTSTNLKIDAARITGKVEVAVDNFDAQVTRLAGATMPILDDGARLSANLRMISAHLLEGRGTLGQLLTDERLYEVMVLSFERAREALDSLRNLMQRFEKSGRIGLNVGGFPVDQKVPQ